MEKPILKTQKLTKTFGALVALKDIDFDVREGEIVGLIGPNGAGKTTLFSIITGFLRPDKGTINFNGEKITGLKPHKICGKGLARTFQLTKSFSAMSVFDNVIVGAYMGLEPEKTTEELIGLVGLSDKKNIAAERLALATKKKLELARALATKPRLLLVDELMAGLNTKEIEEANRLIRSIRDNLGVTIVIVEHIMESVMQISDRIVVLDYGVKIAEGTPSEICMNKRVVEAYLGMYGREHSYAKSK